MSLPVTPIVKIESEIILKKGVGFFQVKIIRVDESESVLFRGQCEPKYQSETNKEFEARAYTDCANKISPILRVHFLTEFWKEHYCK